MKVKDLVALLSNTNQEAELDIKSPSGIGYVIDEQQLFIESMNEKTKEADTFKLRIK